MNTRIFWSFLLSLLFSLQGHTQSPLDGYIQDAINSNIALQRKNLSFDKSMAALREAKANFLPQLSIQARYSVARGGRAFVIPAGDLVNPAYQNLNVINQLGQSTSPDYPVIGEYPVIPNEEINFLRETEQETVLRLQMPVFNNAIIANQKIKANLAEADRIGIETYKRELVKEVKTAYYNYQKAAEAHALFQNTEDLVQENLRTTQSLFENHKLTKDAVYLAQAQVTEVQQQLAEAEKNEKVAQAYFNFLLNREYTAPIERETVEWENMQSVMNLDAFRMQAIQKREELEQFNYFVAASDNNVQLNRGNLLPNINLQADYGIQGTRYTFGREDDFFLGSLVMSWNLFSPNNKAKVQQAQIDKMELFKQKEEVKQQIGLQVVQAWYEVEAANKAMTQAGAEFKATQQAFRLVNKKYQQGQANLLNWQDARTRMTNAEQNQIISRYDYLIQLAGLERASADYSLK